MADAFISYSRRDKAFASALKTRLEADGFALADRTRVCLDQSFRTRFLSEDEKTAAAGSEACRQERQPQ